MCAWGLEGGQLQYVGVKRWTVVAGEVIGCGGCKVGMGAQAACDAAAGGSTAVNATWAGWRGWVAGRRVLCGARRGLGWWQLVCFGA